MCIRDSICTASSVSAARRTLTEKTYDFVIINSPLRDDAGIRLAIDICSNKQSVVLLLVKSDIHNGVHDQVMEYGVFTLSLIHILWLEVLRKDRKMHPVLP